MEKKNKKIYITSSVSIDYFFFLCKIFKKLDYEVKPLYLISESTYRLSSKSLNFNGEVYDPLPPPVEKISGRYRI